ncbi:histidine kinase [Tenacibaculum holothuriorum]|uniref:Histidine kinase n=1 Tax=Tenacibaculum holothuriorum TaxID=1635173 RepID=A0A1Y2PFZ8_9FLAO|nr:histidine kinase [Tenacibaculum holothuriorum]OSY89413.1 histidine kinase [Tenacibaculum holothuriorum]
MRKLFVHQPLFRLLSPVFSGVVVYLLILLVNNNVAQLQEEFLGEELYVCIGLSYVIQEFSRLLLVLYKRLPKVKNEVINFIIQIVVSLFLCVVIVSVSITIYYKNVLGFSPNTEELWLFNSIFCAITFIYILLYISHEYLFKINTERLKNEALIKQSIEADFQDFKQGINPKLLFESLETLLILIEQDKNKADDFIDYLATIYRYILSSKNKQLIEITDEINTSKELVKLFNYLPYRNIVLENNLQSKFLVVPKSLLFIIELIVRTTITTSALELKIIVTDSDEFFKIEYSSNDKITEPFKASMLAEIERVYTIYSDDLIQVEEENNKRTISLPKLTTKL